MQLKLSTASAVSWGLASAAACDVRVDWAGFEMFAVVEAAAGLHWLLGQYSLEACWTKLCCCSCRCLDLKIPYDLTLIWIMSLLS